MTYAQENEPLVDIPGVEPEAVRRELKQILVSRHFRSSKRSQQFLDYVVEQKLLGNEASIKERLIGIALFGRDNNYVTGDDPVVRVQAGEVRRRLERYFSDAPEGDGVRIELPIGTYVPVFHFRMAGIAPLAPVLEPIVEKEVSSDALQTFILAGDSRPDAMLPSPRKTSIPEVFPRPTFWTRQRWSLAVALLTLVVGGAIGYFLHVPPGTPDAVSKFWGPILSNQKSVVMNLGKPFVYVPSAKLFDEYRKNHPGTFEKGVDRHNHYLPLPSDTTIAWADLMPVYNSGPAAGGVNAGLTLSSFLGKFGKAFSVRFGDQGSFLDLRDAPSIIIGAMANSWTTDMDSNFHFQIREDNSLRYISEAGTNRTWRTEYFPNHKLKDYAIITRQPTGSTGQFMLKIAGLQDGGTEAAAELVTNVEMLQNVLRTLPADWQKKNLQIVLETDVIDSKAGPPRVLAYYVW